MTFWQAILQLFIGPLQLIYEFVFFFASQFTRSPGLSIIVLSLAVNLLLLPLYRRADAIQDEESAQQKKMEPWLKHIKKTFSGNERFMMQQTYYRQNNYKIYYSLRGLLPLALEIPFFIAAYRYLSGLADLRGVGFGPIQDLSRPDGLLSVAGTHINVLPILMTVINLVSGAIYTKGLRLRDKLQLYGMALLFLVLLYGSPSGLVIYWTMNNLFSLVKNLLAKLPRVRKAASWLLAALGVGFLVYAFTSFTDLTLKRKLLVILIFAAMIAPAVLQTGLGKKLRARLPRESKKPKFSLFFGGCVFLTLLMGLLIPSAVIQSSPEEFVFAAAYRPLFYHILNSVLLAAGLFMVWLSIFYGLSNNRVKQVMSCLIWVVCGIAVVNYLFFGTKLGTLSSELVYDVEPVFTRSERLLNLGLMVLIGLALAALWIWKRKIPALIYPVLCLAVAGMSVANCVDIQKAKPDILRIVEEYRASVSDQRSRNGNSVSIPLSKDGKNVIVLFMDRAVSSFIPYMMEEKPILKEQFAGFTYYPSTVSFGVHTNFASPPLYGGYEYTPEEMNKRSDEKLMKKHNEALCVMPVLFDENGYDVTVLDPSYANYKWTPDLSLFDQYPDIRAFNTIQGQFNTVDVGRAGEKLIRTWDRNFFLYSAMKCMPYVLQPVIYQHGTYFRTETVEQQQTVTGLSVAQGTAVSYLNNYCVLKALPELTDVREDSSGTFLMMMNETTHCETLLQEPDYNYSLYVDNRDYDAAHADRFTLNGRTMKMDNVRAITHYHVNMSSMLAIGEWLDYLREAGVYDNTRIIIVSDHGTFLDIFSDWELGEGSYEEITSFNPVLMVKDFGSREFRTDNTFMTNADVPLLATDGLMEQVNPFTGKTLSDGPKYADEIYIFDSHQFRISKNKGNTFKPGPWYVLRNVGDMFDAENWTLIEKH